MKRKKFIKASSAIVAGGIISPFISCKSSPSSVQSTQPTRTNWAGNYNYTAKTVHYPKSLDEVQALVKSHDQIKALGSRHCFNNIADCQEAQLSTRELQSEINIDEERQVVQVSSGTRYGDFAEELHERGYGLHNLASLPHITVAGACATATHGSGMRNGNLATAVRAVELVTYDGSVLNISKEENPQLFHAVVVGLGAFGIITRVTLDIQPTFLVRQDIYQELPLKSLADHFDQIMSAGYSVSLFTDWMDELISQIWIKRRTDEVLSNLGKTFFGAKTAQRNLHPITALSSENCTEQMGEPGPWWNRLPHFKMGFTPSSGEELQAEYFVPKANAVDAILALEKKKDLIFPQLFISEIRSVAADRFWMSPCYQQDSVAIHFTWKPNWKEVQKLLPMIEAELAPFGVKPHWGKLFTLDPKVLCSRYARYAEFIEMVKTYDPQGKFRNAYLHQNLFQA